MYSPNKVGDSGHRRAQRPQTSTVLRSQGCPLVSVDVHINPSIKWHALLMVLYAEHTSPHPDIKCANLGHSNGYEAHRVIRRWQGPHEAAERRRRLPLRLH